MKKIISFISAVAICAAVSAPVMAADWQKQYPWAKESVEYCLENNIISGDETGDLMLGGNLTREQILGFYNVLKKVLLNSNSLSDSNDIIKIQKTYLNGSGGLIHDNVAGMKLYEFVPSTQSLNAIVKAMKVNLELVKEEYDTSFSFSIDKKYEEKLYIKF